MMYSPELKCFLDPIASLFARMSFGTLFALEVKELRTRHIAGFILLLHFRALDSFARYARKYAAAPPTEVNQASELLRWLSR